ncbi:MAG: hypothetical protein FJ363_10015 [Gemmatimonadetes bacterium]|nr:hypothetical protein [Gemmatimonadota bacterium]
MLPWLLSLLIGAAAALWLYGRRLPSDNYRRALFALRAVAIALVVALLLDAPLGARSTPRRLTALDASVSWQQGGAGRFAEAIAKARSAEAELLVFGDSVRAAEPPSQPTDHATRVAPAVDRAAALGHPLDIITDGQLDDPESLGALPAGSTITVVPAPPSIDVAVRSLEAPSAATPGDSIELRALVVSAGAPVPSATISVRAGDGTSLATAALGAFPAYTEREWRVRLRVPDRRDALTLRVIASATGDAQPRNDTLTTVLDINAGPSAVFISTAPDQDARFALDFLRGALAFGVRGYLRVAPGQWRIDGTLERIDESAVRAALARAPIAVLHGDTALFGPPRTITRGALALVPPPTGDEGEYFTDRAGPSPLAPALGGVPWDSLPPVSVGAIPVGSAWQALNARRARRYDDRAVIAGWDAPRRVAVLPVRGLWRWNFRGGRSADAFAALWGGVFDWLSHGSVDDRAALVASPWLREGDPVTWRRGASSDSVITVRLRRDGAAADTTVPVRFAPGAITATTPPLAAGVWRASLSGGTVSFAVNASGEWVPRKPIESRAATAGAPATGTRLSLRDQWWWYALAIAMLCAEWWMRRRVGLR